MQAERTFAAMGAAVHVLVEVDDEAAAPPLLDHAQCRVGELEARWSRFVPTSDVSRLNALPSLPVVVARETYALVALAIESWRLTEGRFDPTVLDAVVAAGYDRSFELIGAGVGARAQPHTAAPPPAPGCAAIELDPLVGAVRLGAGVHFDPGGIGKGLAADIVTRTLLARDARGACVNVGGDLRVEGDAPGGRGWLVEVRGPAREHRPSPALAMLRLRRGAVASTWRTERAWTASDGTPRHHLVDPATGDVARTGLAGVSVVAGHAWLAEVLAKAAFVAGPDGAAAVLAEHDVAGVVVTDSGSMRTVGPLDRLRA